MKKVPAYSEVGSNVEPGGSALQNLRHTMAEYENALDEDFALRATGGVWLDDEGQQVSTGLRWSDLRLLHELVEAAVAVGEWSEDNDPKQEQWGQLYSQLEKVAARSANEGEVRK